MSKLGFSKIQGLIAIVAFAIIILFVLSSMLFETNTSGYYQVKQAAVSGDMSVKSTPGFYGKMFGEIHTYQVSDMYYFSKYKQDGGDGVGANPIEVRFNDGGTAVISGSIKYRLSLQEKDQIKLHSDFKSYETVKQDLIRQVVTESLMQTSTLMKAEESYSTRRSEFTTLAEGQIKEGIYETYTEEYKKKNSEGKDFIIRAVKVRLNNGVPVIRKISPFRRYNIEILQFVIKDIDFDKTIDTLIRKKKKAEQEKVVARANAEKAKQDAITTAAQGKARIATAKADEEVEKIKSVTQALRDKEVGILNAERKFKVAELSAKEAEQKAKKIVAEGRAEAESNKLKVEAGLSPQEKAEWDYKTAVGVAEHYSKVKVPTIVIGGGSGASGANPLDAIGINMLLDIQQKIIKIKDAK